mmetsp:Transcript_7547/g.9298  ORF Transcript_7547/g.9298 Transcript_7547/m.9298 type:complete len:188 (-) Transcript_7547:276-839(-)
MSSGDGSRDGLGRFDVNNSVNDNDDDESAASGDSTGGINKVGIPIGGCSDGVRISVDDGIEHGIGNDGNIEEVRDEVNLVVRYSFEPVSVLIGVVINGKDGSECIGIIEVGDGIKVGGGDEIGFKNGVGGSEVRFEVNDGVIDKVEDGDEDGVIGDVIEVINGIAGDVSFFEMDLDCLISCKQRYLS